MLQFVIFIVYLAIGYFLAGCTEVLYARSNREIEKFAAYIIIMLFWPIGCFVLLFALIEDSWL